MERQILLECLIAGPGYMSIQRKKDRIEAALARLEAHETECRLCPRDCGINRAAGERGYCESGREAVVSHALLHFGEEPVLSGTRDGADDRNKKESKLAGSGTIFFAGCNLKCGFCQNYQLSWLGRGRPVKDEELARMMIDLQDKGAFNINLVSPTHFLLPILRALWMAYSKGLEIPLVSNSNGYEKASVLAHLEGIIDIYLPDLKFFSSSLALRVSEAPDYFARAGDAVKEMAYQQPVLVLDDRGIARRGLIVRHLVLPGQAGDTRAILDWLARELGASVAVSLMSQYQPCFRPPEDMKRPLAKEEYAQALSVAEKLGFQRLFVQPGSFAPDEHLVPDFNRAEPFQWAGKRDKS
jgi:putative pyruvate formate lyase activating enzyme